MRETLAEYRQTASTSGRRRWLLIAGGQQPSDGFGQIRRELALLQGPQGSSRLVLPVRVAVDNSLMLVTALNTKIKSLETFMNLEVIPEQNIAKLIPEIIEEKITADAPVASYKGEPVTKGKGRFGPFLKWKDLFINVPARYNFENLNQAEINELISAKVEKEANRFIQQWEKEKISIENGRWGPFIRFGKAMLKLSKNPKTNDKFTPEELAVVDLEEVKKMIVAQVPDAFEAKAKKKAPTKKAVAKKK